jgi:hypothetical protein
LSQAARPAAEYQGTPGMDQTRPDPNESRGQLDAHAAAGIAP